MVAEIEETGGEEPTNYRHQRTWHVRRHGPETEDEAVDAQPAAA